MERLPFHELNNKYNSLIDQQLNTINTIHQLFIQKQQLQASIVQWEAQTQDYLAWEENKKTQEMKLIRKNLESPEVQERLHNFHNQLLMQEQQQQAQFLANSPSEKPNQFRRLRR